MRVVNYIFYGRAKHLSRFSMVGVANTLIDFLVFTAFHSLIGVNYVVSQALGYSFGVTNSFIFNKKWTFQDKNANKKTFYELLQFIVVNVTSLAFTLVFMGLLVKNFGMNVYISKIIVTIIAQIINFLAYKLWVFN